MVDWCSSVEYAWLESLSHFYLVCKIIVIYIINIMLVPGDINPIITIPVPELSWRSLNVSTNSSNPDNDNTSVSKVSWWWCTAALRLLPQSLLSQITTLWNHDHSQDQDHHFGLQFRRFKISFRVKQKLLLKTNSHFGQVGNADVSDIANVFSPTFVNPTFRYSPVVKCEKLDV